MRTWRGLFLAFIFVAASTSASSAEREELQKLRAPVPAERSTLPAIIKPQPVRLVRAVVQLSPEPWARVELWIPDGENPVEYVTWTEGRDGVDLPQISNIFAEEMTAAGVPLAGSAKGLFEEATVADLQVGVRVTEMKGRFCKGCGRGTPVAAWVGVVTMDAHWEVYSQLRGKVLAVVETQGGFTAPKGGLVGDPERLIYGAFRDNIRHLVASEQFQRAVAIASPSTTDGRGSALTPVFFVESQVTKRTLPTAAESVVGVFAGDGMASGFLISKDGYLLTNHHVVGGAKYVKIRWSDRVETVGEVIRTDPRRDVALIKTDPHGRAPLTLRLAGIPAGEAVFAIGMPLEEKFQGTLTKGVVSANRVYDGIPFIQSDVAVDHGNSGGPLLDENGRVVGITDWGYRPDQVTHNLNFFIPIDDALRALALKPAG